MKFDPEWAIAESTFNYIKSILPEGKTILEIGSGWGTGFLANHYKMYSIEANKDWVGKFKSTYIYAPIKMYDMVYQESLDSWQLISNNSQDNYMSPDIVDNFGWHDPDIVKSKIENIKYDLILIDGPEGRIGRGGFYKHLELFNTNVPMIFDDIGRKAEMDLLKKVSQKVKRDYILLDDNVTGVIL